MTKKEYQKPVMLIVEADFKQQILAGSLTSVSSTGLDDDLILPDDEESKSGNVWEEAW
jgi:hypothetical protein